MACDMYVPSWAAAAVDNMIAAPATLDVDVALNSLLCMLRIELQCKESRFFSFVSIYSQ